MNTSDVELVQRYYPQIYLACHKRHIRASSTGYRLSARDSSILVHLSETVPVTPTELAAHLSVRGSTLSAAIQRLEALGYLLRKRIAGPSKCRAHAHAARRQSDGGDVGPGFGTGCGSFRQLIEVNGSVRWKDLSC